MQVILMTITYSFLKSFSMNFENIDNLLLQFNFKAQIKMLRLTIKIKAYAPVKQ